MSSSPKASIDLNAIRHNLALAKSCAPQAKFMAVIKADAYGHGLLQTAHALAAADGLAVARLEEAIALRDAGIAQRLLLLGSRLSDRELAACATLQVDVVVHSIAMSEQLAGLNLSSPLNAWLKIDTGMHRLGISPAEYSRAHQLMQSSANIDKLLAMTHFSASDATDPASCQQQTRLFLSTLGDSATPTSMANSAALIQQPQSHGDWVRPGIMLYGANPLQQNCSLSLKPAMTLTATVLAIREVAAGESVGYNGIWTATQATRIATIGVGYGDGYPRHAVNGTPVLIRGQRARLAGRVSMDMITVDISDCSSVCVGDEATLWGVGLPVEEVADLAGTISYELLTGVSARVARSYLD